MARPKPQRKSYGDPAKHPGVTIYPLPEDADGKPTHDERGELKRGCAAWIVRWREAGASRSKSIYHQPLTEVVKFAIRKFKTLSDEALRVELARFKAEKLGLDPDAPEPERRSIHDASSEYYGGLCVMTNRPRSTLRGANYGLLAFIHWHYAHGIRYLDELTVDVLKAWRKYLIERPLLRPKRDGRTTYKISAVNQILKPVRAMLRIECALDHCPHLTDARLRLAIPHVPVHTADDRKGHNVESAMPLTPEQVHALLDAAVRRDRDYLKAGWPAPPCASDIALSMLLGTRRDEYTRAKCSDVGRDDDVGVYVHIKGKGRREREVGMLHFSRIGADILRAQTRGHSEAVDGWLSHNTYVGLADALFHLHKGYGAPLVTSHDLRATCASYQAILIGVAPQDCADRLGHKLAENQETYVQRIKGALRQQTALEDAMRARKDFAAVRTLMKSYPVAARPMVDALGHSTRVRSSGANEHSLAAKDPTALERVLAKLPPVPIVQLAIPRRAA